MSRVFSLRFHADYRCQQSGACCSSDWDVPVELPVFRQLDEALRKDHICPVGTPHEDVAPLIVEEGLPDEAAAMLARTASGQCVFYHPDRRLCMVHHRLGHEALPATCRHFPRVAVRDPRGTFVSLTHYCPTAASMLFRDVPIDIVADPPAFPPSDYEGLIVTSDAWPPLLHPHMLMDFDGYAAWERHMVRRCAEEDATPEDVVATLMRDARVLLDFDPLKESLLDRIAALPKARASVQAPMTLDESLAHVSKVAVAVPSDLRPEPDETGLREAWTQHVRPEWSRWHAPLRRYLAAKAFSNWTAYQGRGILAIVVGLDAALALVRVSASRRCRDAGRTLDQSQLLEAIRATDFVLNHLAVGEELAAAWSATLDRPPDGCEGR